jgi:hypothetical protein
MAYNTKPIVKDSEGKPIPQYYNQISNQYEPMSGASGGQKVTLYDSAGQEVNLMDMVDSIKTAIDRLIEEVKKIAV